MSNEKLHVTINKSLLIILAILIFLLGRYSVPMEIEIDIPYRIKTDTNNPKEVEELIVAISKYDETEIDNDLSRSEQIEEANKEKNISIDIGEYSYVASKRGKKFYEIKSSKAQNLSEKNKIYFKTKEEAIKEGYEE